MDNIQIKRALISVYDKTNIVEFARTLSEFNCEIISTGGTAKKLRENGIDIINIESITGNPEAFSGRMKTISFNIESALLYDRVKDKEEAKKLNIKPIDMVVCNLYPFKKVLEEGAELETLIENIDIGGPTMIRAGAKNFNYVAVVSNPFDYPQIIEELKSNNGNISYETRKYLMAKAFNHTADYDALIATSMDKQIGQNSIRLAFEKGQELRYGENSHQKASYYRKKGSINSLYDMEVLQGKEISFNNILDINAAVESVRRLNNIACSVIKHGNPCGLCEGNNHRKVFELAWGGDPVSAFGSIIAFNTKLEKDTVEFLNLNNNDMSKRKMIHVIIAPDYTEEALEYLKFRKKLIILKYDISKMIFQKDFRYLNGLLLEQDTDNKLYDKLDIVTEKSIDIEQNKNLIEFGLKCLMNIKSNTMALVRNNNGFMQLLGMGAGQPNRVNSTSLALERAKENLILECKDKNKTEDYIKEEMSKAILLSDAYIPFPDNIEVANEYGIKIVIQPGGSVKDKDVIEECNKNNIAMLFTGTRHFRH